MSEYEYQQSGGQGPTVYGAGGGVVSFVPQEGPLWPGSDPLAPVQQEKFQPDAQATEGGGWLPDLPLIDMPWEGSFPEIPENIPDVLPWEGLVPDLPLVDVVPPDITKPMTLPGLTIPFEPDFGPHPALDAVKPLVDPFVEGYEGTKGAVEGAVEAALPYAQLGGLVAIALIIPVFKQLFDNRR